MSDTKTLIELIDEYAETRHRCGCATYNAKTEAARKAVIEALSGVQALSAELGASRAAPPSAYVDGAGIRAEDGASAVISKLDARFHEIVNFKEVDAAAASPTPPAEQQASATEVALVGAYARLPDFDSGDEPIWEAVFKWKAANPGSDASKKAMAVEGAIIKSLRDFADRTHALRMEQAATKAAPVVWLSSKQLRGVTALHGQYLPFRCQPEGRFDTPVYLAEAAPKAAPGEPSDAEIDEFIDLHCWDANGRRSIVRHAIARWGAAPTTRPAPQQEAPKAAPGESDYSKKWDAELGRTAMRFVDRAGDVHPGIDDAETICAEFHKAMSEVIERMPHVRRMAAPHQEPASPIRVRWGRDYQDGGKPIDASAAPVPDFAAILHQEAQERDASRCSHEWDGLARTSMPPKYACKHCHNFFDAPPSPAPQHAPAPLSEREAFEAWIEKDGGDLGTFGTPPNMHYRNSAVNNAWVAWKARAALAAQGDTP